MPQLSTTPAATPGTLRMTRQWLQWCDEADRQLPSALLFACEGCQIDLLTNPEVRIDVLAEGATLYLRLPNGDRRTVQGHDGVLIATCDCGQRSIIERSPVLGAVIYPMVALPQGPVP